MPVYVFMPTYLSKRVGKHKNIKPNLLHIEEEIL